MRKKTKIFIGSFLLAGALTAGVLCAGYAARDDRGGWFKNGNMTTWHWSDKSDDTTPTSDNVDDLDDLTQTGGVDISHDITQTG